MFTNKSADGRNNICGTVVAKLRKELRISQRELADRHVSSDIESIMERRSVYQYREGMVKNPVVEDTDKYFAAVAAPILAEGDVLGCVILASADGGAMTGDTEYKLIQTIAGFLGKHMET